MKQKITITIDEKTAESVEIMLKDALFRNRSHLVEYSLNKLIQENKIKEI
jgi:Arc/MetJ-type ribon-helix-helix transcriptional regulator